MAEREQLETRRGCAERRPRAVTSLAQSGVLAIQDEHRATLRTRLVSLQPILQALNSAERTLRRRHGLSVRSEVTDRVMEDALTAGTLLQIVPSAAATDEWLETDDALFLFVHSRCTSLNRRSVSSRLHNRWWRTNSRTRVLNKAEIPQANSSRK